MSLSSKSYLNLTINTSKHPVNTSDFKLDVVNISQNEVNLITSNSKPFNRIPSTIDPSTSIRSLFSSQTNFNVKDYVNHTDDNYKINPSAIVDWSETQSPGLKLNAADFAYLKDIGIYPDNRLIIARRFPAPVGNDLSSIQVSPLATLISWVDENEDFFKITYGEEWDEASATFETILNNMGENLQLPGSDNKMGQLGTWLSKGANLVTLPGLIEGLQYKLFTELGIVDKTTNEFLIPTGDPNLIRQAKQRKILDKKQAGSGLKCAFSIDMKVEYEIKYINGVDPTITYFDIIANALSFATSDARFMFNENLNNKGRDFINSLMNGDIQGIKKQIENFIVKLQEVIKGLSVKLIDYINNLFKPKDDKNKNNVVNKSTLDDLIQNTLGAVIGKYKVALMGVLNALTGAHSTPWHVTIGNPKRPIFSSGDLYTDDVKMSMGPILGFNDLPSSIKLEFTLKPARNLGASEIFERFSISGSRTYKSIYSRGNDIFSKNNDFLDSEKYKFLDINSEEGRKAIKESIQSQQNWEDFVKSKYNVTPGELDPAQAKIARDDYQNYINKTGIYTPISKK